MRYSKAVQKNILSRSNFLERLRVEKIRTDRSKTPLSMILFSVGQKETKGNQLFVGELLSHLSKNTRETDVKGWVAPDLLGLLLLDTDQKGARRCTEKILNGNRSTLFSVIMATYPDDNFQQLLDKKEGHPDPSPFDLDEPRNPYRLSSLSKNGMEFVGSLIGQIKSLRGKGRQRVRE